jgi:dihydrolipoamide dehydrogenase
LRQALKSTPYLKGKKNCKIIKICFSLPFKSAFQTLYPTQYNMANQYDVIVVGSGPGGYVAAIRASQLGLKTAVVERESLGGICLNWGCIPTKALLKSAQVFEYIQHAKDYGIEVKEASANFDGMVKRSRDVAGGMSKGIQFLFKKNKIDAIFGNGKLLKGNQVEVTDAEGKKALYSAKHIILATGGRARELPALKIDNEKIIGYRKAMVLEKQPESMVVVGSGAIGVEFAYFYSSIGTKVTIVEFMPNIVPVEDEEISKQLEKTYKSKGIDILTNSEVTAVDTSGKGCKVKVKNASGEQIIECDIVLSAVGVIANIENIGLEEVGVKTEKGKVIVDEFYRTNIAGVYAIGDITAGQALAHVASAEGIICVEKIAGHHPEPLDYNNIPGCTYCSPEIASVGYTEKKAKEAGYEIKVGKFPFSASGKASAGGAKEGFVKVIFDAKYGEFLGAHMIGANVTEMIAEVVVARKLETTGHEIVKSVHPHPTMSEAIMEAAAAAYGEVIQL